MRGRKKSRMRIGARVPVLFVLIALIAAGVAECMEWKLSQIQDGWRANAQVQRAK
jgi:hypothetical protein